ncbi:MAG TPA: DUF481 domain-containing protein [Sphingomonadales bacterium]
MTPKDATRIAAAALALWAAPQAALAQIPPAVEAMIRAAAKGGDEAELKAVVKAAKATNPGLGDEIDALAAQEASRAKAEAAATREAELRRQSYFEGWTGAGEAGFSFSGGNTKETSGLLGLRLEKDGIRIRHKIAAVADYLRTNGETTREKFLASYDINYKLDARFYIYGQGMWERDRFAGYSRRFTESVGLGYRAIDRENMTLDLEAGPSLRQTRYTTGESDDQLAARANLAYRWEIRDGLVFSQDAGAIMGSGGSTYLSDTALTARLFGGVSARVSFNVEHETNPPDGLKKTDYATRLTGVYEF